MKLSISHLEQLSGVPIHTIRIWERRYHALTPNRSLGNTRIYSDLDLKRLLDIVSLVNSGIKISLACSLNNQQVSDFLETEIHKTLAKDEKHEFYVSQLLKYGLTFNEIEFSKYLNACVESYGLEKSYQFIIYPMLRRVGLLWRKEEVCPAQEHFLTHLIRQKLMASIDQTQINIKLKSTWLLCLPADESHDIPLLFANYLLRKNGFKVIYLGEKVPMLSINNAINQNKIDHLLLFMVRQRPIIDTQKFLNEIISKNVNVKIHIAGNDNLIESLNMDSQINHLNSISSFIAYLQNICHAN